MSGQKGVAILIVAMLLTVGIGYFANVTEEEVTRTTYNKITDLEGIIGENAGKVSSYGDYSPTSNVTGWYGNSIVHTTADGVISPYVINPRGVTYTPSTYDVNMRSFTYTTGQINYESANSISESNWSTSKDGVTFASYPIVGTSSTDSQTTWIKYSDGSPIHGGVSATKGHSSIGIGYFSQLDSIKYYIGDERPTSSVKIFATIEEVLTKAGVTLGNNYQISTTGNVLYGCNLYADKYLSNQEYGNNGDLRRFTTNVDIHLQGYKNTASVIKYMNGEYSGLNDKGEAVWTSSNVYIYTTKSTISVTVNVPSITNPQYADPYKLTTIKDSGYTLDPVTSSYTFDWADYPLTTTNLMQNETFTIDKDVSPYIVSTQYVTDTYGDISATVSDGTTISSYEDSFLELYENGVWGYSKYAPYSYTWNGHSYSSTVAPYIVNNTVNSGYAYYMYSSELISKYIPNPIEGDKVSFTLNSGVSKAVMIEPDTDYSIEYGNYGSLRFSVNYWVESSNRVAIDRFESGRMDNFAISEHVIQLSSVYFKYTNGIWIPYKIADNQEYEYNDMDWSEVESGVGYDLIKYIKPGNLIMIQSNESDGVPSMNITLNYTRNTIQFATTDSDVTFADFNNMTLSDGSPLYGGQSTDWITLDPTIDSIAKTKLAYSLSGERENLRWINLREMCVGLDSRVLSTATKITVSGESNTKLYENLTLNPNISYPIPQNRLYTITLTGNAVDCDYLAYNMEGYWQAYSGTNVVWDGQLSDLTLVTDSTGDISVEIVTEGFSFGDNPTSDSTVAYWSNGVNNATIVNGKVSFLLVPTGSVQTDIYIYTGDTVIITATPQSGGYNFVFTVGTSAPVSVGNYAGLYITYSLSDNKITVNGLFSITNTVAYSKSSVSLESTLTNTDSLKFIYFEALGADWGAYITETSVQNDPLGMLWGGFDVNLNNYLSTYIPGLRVAINGVVAYGDTITINGIEMPVEDGKITYKEKKYVLKGSAVDYTVEGKTYLTIGEGTKAVLNLGDTQTYNISGEGSWYFASSAYAIDDVKSKEFQWNPNWELNWDGCLVLFIVAIVLIGIVCSRLDLFGGLEMMDWVVMIGAIIICFSLVGGIGQ